MLNRVSKDSQGRPAAPLGPVPASLEDCEDLWLFLGLAAWPSDAAPRTPGTVMLFVDSGILKVMLNDKDACRVAFLTIDPADELLSTIDSAIGASSTDWRAAKPPQNGRR